MNPRVFIFTLHSLKILITDKNRNTFLKDSTEKKVLICNCYLTFLIDWIVVVVVVVVNVVNVVVVFVITDQRLKSSLILSPKLKALY